MRLFIESRSLYMWKIIEQGHYIPMVDQPPQQEGQPPQVAHQVAIQRNQWTNTQKAKVQLNAKAKYLLTYALSKSEYD